MICASTMVSVSGIFSTSMAGGPAGASASGRPLLASRLNGDENTVRRAVGGVDVPLPGAGAAVADCKALNVRPLRVTSRRARHACSMTLAVPQCMNMARTIATGAPESMNAVWYSDVFPTRWRRARQPWSWMPGWLPLRSIACTTDGRMPTRMPYAWISPVAARLQTDAQACRATFVTSPQLRNALMIMSTHACRHVCVQPSVVRARLLMARQPYSCTPGTPGERSIRPSTDGSEPVFRMYSWFGVFLKISDVISRSTFSCSPASEWRAAAVSSVLSSFSLSRHAWATAGSARQQESGREILSASDTRYCAS
eukprot:m.143115 g.143115  ORF g.143115 m.143115 type:complete len:312 (+) comp9659_c0_seq6:718-1653(+)